MMAAREHLQGEQLAMFMPASELMQHGDAGVEFNGRLTDDEMWDIKREDNASRWGIGESVRREGVKEPVHLVSKYSRSKKRPLLWQGYHRVVAANDEGDQLVPVMHHANAKEYKKHEATYLPVHLRD